MVKKTLHIKTEEGVIHEEVDCDHTTTLDGEYYVKDNGPDGVMNEKDILKLLARPIWILQTSSNYWIYRHKGLRMFCFTSPASAATFMWGKSSSLYQLFVGKKTYPWGDGEVGSLRKHIRQCMDIEGAFFDNESCKGFFEGERATRVKFKAHKIE